MLPELNPMEDVDTDNSITLPISLGQYAQLENDRVRPGVSRVTHKIAVGPHYLPGVWVVVGTQRLLSTMTPQHFVTIAPLRAE